MKDIQVLDCTLRDGGYCNNWMFGRDNIKKIVKKLILANIDIVECGFLTNKASGDKDSSKFIDLDSLRGIIPVEKNGRDFVVMVNYGEYDMNKLPQFDNSTITGIRLAFHKEYVEEALSAAEIVSQKGYKIFLQPMVTLRYKDAEFIRLIEKANKIAPEAFYIVDSFGAMKQEDVLRYLYLTEFNLNKNIKIGFHSHNNLQLAYSNAQSLMQLHSKHKKIIDASVYGMGRGAGNLTTELFVEYLNKYMHDYYQIPPLLTIVDEVLYNFYESKGWGYSLPNYISAINNAHPNYAGFFDDKKTLTIEQMNELFIRMDSRKYSYNKKYANDIYMAFMSEGCINLKHWDELQREMKGCDVLLLGPGRSVNTEKDKILEFMKNNPKCKVISVNYESEDIGSNYIFVSNARRFNMLGKDKLKKSIVTSNIIANDTYLQPRYQDLTNEVDMVKDNAGLMAIKFCKDMGVRKVFMAGFDGYSRDYGTNYASERFVIFSHREVIDAMNKGMEIVMKEYKKDIEIEFITKTKYKI